MVAPFEYSSHAFYFDYVFLAAAIEIGRRLLSKNTVLEEAHRSGAEGNDSEADNCQRYCPVAGI
jgi:hypothetical protein